MTIKFADVRIRDRAAEPPPSTVSWRNCRKRSSTLPVEDPIAKLRHPVLALGDGTSTPSTVRALLKPLERDGLAEMGNT